MRARPRARARTRGRSGNGGQAAPGAFRGGAPPPPPPPGPPEPRPTLPRHRHRRTDAWSIHTGSCGYGQLAEDVGTGARAAPACLWGAAARVSACAPPRARVEPAGAPRLDAWRPLQPVAARLVPRPPTCPAPHLPTPLQDGTLRRCRTPPGTTRAAAASARRSAASRWASRTGERTGRVWDAAPRARALDSSRRLPHAIAAPQPRSRARPSPNAPVLPRPAPPPALRPGVPQVWRVAGPLQRVL
jgi:hypothetical protein